MEIISKKLGEIRPYEKNPRKNDAAVEYVANSIRSFGFRVPIVIDKDGIIVCGHTRWKAAKKLGMKEVPCIMADDLSPDQIKAFRLADNRVAEMAEWDFDFLNEELAGIEMDMTDFGFLDETPEDWFDKKDKGGKRRQEGNDEYNSFLEQFEPKRTTDDCYTPDLVYDAVAGWVEKEYGVQRSQMVRPFFPGGDYQRYQYPEGAVVVDNPPFSILAQILKWYHDNGVRFFLFGPTLTLFSSSSAACCAIPCGCSVYYDNGATVCTSFLTNLEPEDTRVRTAPDLCQAVQDASDAFRAQTVRKLPNYSYPDEVITSAMVARWSKYGVDFRLSVQESELIEALDAQKEAGKTIFGRGYLLSERAAAERAAAERAAAERAAAHKWELSAREKEIVRRLSDEQQR